MPRSADQKRVTVTLSSDEYQQLQYWANKKEMSVNDFLRMAIQFRIAWENRDYDLAPLEVQRMNQLVDVVVAMSQNVKNLESVLVSGFDSLLGLTRGDNYLLEEESGDI